MTKIKTKKEAFELSLFDVGNTPDFPKCNCNLPTNIVGYSVIINGLLHLGYRGRTTWATKSAANREARSFLSVSYTNFCYRNELLSNRYCNALYDDDFNEYYKQALESGKVKIVQITLPKDV